MVRRVLPVLVDAVVFARTYQRVERALRAFGMLLLPSSCVVCGAWDTSLCPACLALFRRATVRPFRAEDGAESLPDILLQAPVGMSVGSSVGMPGGRHGPGTAEGNPGVAGSADAPYGPLPVIAAGRYHGPVPAVLLAFKNHGHVDLTAPVAAALAGALHAAVSEFRPAGSPAARLGIVPVPTRGASRRKRGYDPLDLLLTALRRTGNLPAGTFLLPAAQQIPLRLRLFTALTDGAPAARCRALARALLPTFAGGQKGLGRRRRRTQVACSMQAARRGRSLPAGTPCIIVDDVLTTGATLGEVHRVLTAAGARVLGAVVVAATAPPAGGSVDVPVLELRQDASSTPAVRSWKDPRHEVPVSGG